MQFTLLFAEPQSDFDKRKTPETNGPYMGAWASYIGSIAEAGVMRGGEGLMTPDTATTVSKPNGERIVQDGPFMEAKEYLGGLVTIEVDALDDAIEWAEKSPAAVNGRVEIRPVMSSPAE